MSFIQILSLGGAFADVTERETAFGGSRAIRCLVNVTAVAPEAELLATERAWVRSLWQALLPHASEFGGYVNCMADCDENSVQVAYGPAKYQRLARIKARYDPDNVFRTNANIKPTGGIEPE